MANRVSSEPDFCPWGLLAFGLLPLGTKDEDKKKKRKKKKKKKKEVRHSIYTNPRSTAHAAVMLFIFINIKPKDQKTPRPKD